MLALVERALIPGFRKFGFFSFAFFPPLCLCGSKTEFTHYCLTGSIFARQVRRGHRDSQRKFSSAIKKCQTWSVDTLTFEELSRFMQNQAALELQGISKQYPGVLALNDVNICFRKGEIHGLVGENGAGKSTLIKILAGLVRADQGAILCDGVRQQIHSARDARRLGISCIHQELNLISYFTCPENVFLGHPYPKTLWGTIAWSALRNKTRGILERLDVDIPLNVPVMHLAPGEQAMVAIARAFAESAVFYCMDEPTTSLTEHEKLSLFAVIRNLKSLGATVMYVSHDLDDVLALTDKITVMRDGQVVGTWDTREMSKDTLISKMIGRDIGSTVPSKSVTGRETVLSVSEAGNARIRDISFDLRAGEILGIAGLLGSGRTEILRMIYGVDPLYTGKLTLRGQAFWPKSPKDSIGRGLVLIPEERRSQGLLLDRSIYENISLVYLDTFANGPFLSSGAERPAVERIGQAVQLKAADYTHHVNTLSGGNQQKVVFAKYLLCRPTVLMLDEPTKGVDVGARFEIYSVIREMAQQGTAVLLVSSDFTELIGLADRFLVLHEGRQTGITDKIDLDQEMLLQYCYGKMQTM